MDPMSPRRVRWGAPPDGTRTFALVMDAPGRTWVHWALYDLPAGVRELPQGIPADAELASGARQGRNDFGKLGYGGPCPPPGKPHHYFFRLYALDAKLGLKPGAKKTDVQIALAKHLIASAELVGTYQRK